MPERLKITITCLHISAFLYALAGLIFCLVLMFLQGADPYFIGVELGIAVFVCSLLLTAGVEFVIQGLQQLRYWAWIAALIICGFYVTSCLLPLGVLGLWGLLDNDTQATFNRTRGRS